MSVPETKIVMIDFATRELPGFMKALCSALPGTVWFSEVIHQTSCPHNADKTLEDDQCVCVVARLVMVTRLQPVRGAVAGNGAGR